MNWARYPRPDELVGFGAQLDELARTSGLLAALLVLVALVARGAERY